MFQINACQVNAFQLPAAFVLSDSAYISAGGENTTARLTPPTGKTASDFTAGRIQDDENPCAAVDIANNCYTEIEWCIKATTNVSDGEVYQFRITVDETVLDTYTYTPTWTVGTPSGGSIIPLLMRTYRSRRVN